MKQKRTMPNSITSSETDCAQGAVEYTVGIAATAPYGTVLPIFLHTALQQFFSVVQMVAMSFLHQSIQGSGAATC